MPFIAIDPGLKGALVLFSDQGQVIAVRPMPILKEGTKARQDNNALLALFYEWKAEFNPLEAVIEEPLVFHNKKGIYSVGTVLRNIGRIEGMLTTLGLNVHTVSPKQWQAFYPSVSPLESIKIWKLDKTKQQSITQASNLFPSISLISSSRSRKPSDGIADALLIGHFWAERGYNKG